MNKPDPRDEIIEHLPAMRAFALSLTQNAALADDIVQDTIVKAWTSFDSFQPGTKLRAWLFTILRNNFYTYHRKHGREVEDIDGAHAAQLVVSPSHDGKLMLDEVMAAFDKLTVEQKEVLLLVGASGFSYEEAAEMCGVSLGTIKSRINRGRNALTKLLGYDGDDSLDITDKKTKAVINNSGDAA